MNARLCRGHTSASVREGLEFVVEDTGDGIKLKPMSPYSESKAEELLGCVGYQGPKKSLKEMEAAIAKGAREKL